MPTKVMGDEVAQVIAAAREGGVRTVAVDGVNRDVVYPFPSPGDWRDCSMYFLMVDRFNNPNGPPNGTWDRRYDYWQGGTLAGVKQQLGYLADLGIKAIWLSPVLKNSKPPEWKWNYHGYAAQDFLSVDERFGSEKDLEDLVAEAHARGLYVILDIVLNHAARVFDYVRNDRTEHSFADPAVLYGPLGSEPAIQWLNGYGYPRSDWTNDIPEDVGLSPDDAVYPDELQEYLFFRRRGSKVTDKLDGKAFVPGDFGVMRQLVVEYDATVPGQERIRQVLGPYPVLTVLIRAYSYLVARFDFDGFRLDTVKYVHPDMIQTFGNAIREFALSIGKKNFFTFGEVYDDEQNIAKFVGRNGGNREGFGIDAALDFPLYYKLPQVAKALGDEGVEAIRRIFEARKGQEAELISSHGEAGRFFVTFLDNHDQHQRVKHPSTPAEQVTLALAVIFGLQGIPCIYYGTEQGLDGTKKEDTAPDLDANESVREALWGKPNAFDRGHSMYRAIQAMARLRNEYAALRYGRLYFRPISGNGIDFGQSYGRGGVIAFSRILSDSEIIVVANTHASASYSGFVVVDADINRGRAPFTVLYSNKGKQGQGTPETGTFSFWEDGTPAGSGTAVRLYVELDAMEVQILGVRSA